VSGRGSSSGRPEVGAGAARDGPVVPSLTYSVTTSDMLAL
jgi:hypothetical protein